MEPQWIRGPACWIELNVEKLLHNLAGVRALVGPARVMAVVKANAYGAGAVGVARALAEAGVDAFGVGSVAEGAALRAGGIPGEICCLTYFTGEDVAAILDYDLSPAIYRVEDARLLGGHARAGRRALGVWIKVDTGLGRLGLAWRQAAAQIHEIRELAGLEIRGLLSTLTENPERDPEQARRLVAVRGQLRAKVALPLSLASSNGILSQPGSYLDVVRPGIMLLGWEPSERARLDAGLLRRADLHPIATWKARVLSVKTVEQGEQVGYGLRPALARDIRVAALAAGWATGYPPAMAGSGDVLLAGRRCSVLAVSAHTTLVDAGRAPEARANAEAVLLGRQAQEEITGEEMARAAGESVYHLLARVPVEVHRLWT